MRHIFLEEYRAQSSKINCSIRKIYDSGNQEVVEELLKTIMTESIKK